MGRMAWLVVVVWVIGAAGAAWAGPVVPGVSGRPTWSKDSTRVVVGVPDRHWSRGLVESDGRYGDLPRGFAVEITEQALRSAGLRAEFRTLFGSDPVEALERGEVDVVAPLSISGTRMERVDFTTPIVMCRGAVVSRPGVTAPGTIEGLRGQRVTTAGGGVGDEWCAAAGVSSTRAGSLANALRRVADGRSDFAVSLEMAARWEIEHLGIKPLAVTPLEGTEHARAFALAVRSGDEVMANRLNHALAQLREDGTYERLYAAWLTKYQSPARPAMVLESTLRWVAGTALVLLSAAAVVQLMMYRRLSARTRAMRETQRALREGESNYRAIFEGSNDAVIIFEPRGQKILAANRRACAMYGYRPEELVGLSLETVSTDAAAGRARVAETVAEGRHNGFVTRHRRRNGEIISVEVRASVIEYRGERVVMVVNRDVTERERAAQRLAAQEAEYRAITEALPALVYSYFRGADGSGGPRFSNSRLDEWKRVFPSLDPGAPYRSTIEKDIHPDDLRRYTMETERSRRTRTKFDVEFRLRTFDGRYRWVHTTLVPLQEPGGVLWQGLMLDVDDLRWAQEALRVSEERARLLLDHVGVIAWEAKAGSPDLSYVSGQAEALTGYSVAEWLAPGFWAEHIHPDDRDWAVRLCTESTARGESHEFEYRFVAKDGRVLRLRDIVTVESRDGRPAFVRGVMVDVTALRESEEALAASEKRFRSMIENSYGGVLLMDAEGRVIYDNGGIERVLGHPPRDLVGRFANDVVHPEDLEAVRAHDSRVLAAPGAHRVIEFRAAHRDGSWRWIETTDTNHLGDPAIGAVVCNYRDVTERKQMEQARRRLDQEVMQTQKAESLGVLVGGVAHDFNNLLTGIAGNTALALRTLPESDPARACVQQIDAAALRAIDLTRNMLAYAGKGRITTRPVDLREVLKDTLALVSGSLSRSAPVRTECADGLPPAECDPAQISQVMMNLLLNASDAIGDRRRGEIRVKISRETPGPADHQDAFPAGWAGRGPMLCVEVEDNGCGMTPDIRARIFDPFFTTKFAGRGLGLAAALGIVRGHGGAITVRSRPGEGSLFRVWLPRAIGPVEAQPQDAQAPAPPRGKGTLLVVDDERLVLDLVGKTLELAGFTVLKATGGPEALRLLQNPGTPRVDGVLLDLTMPEMDGETALRKIREICPSMPVVLMSGYSEGDIMSRLAGVETKSFLQKPFRLDDLITTARGLVGAAA